MKRFFDGNNLDIATSKFGVDVYAKPSVTVDIAVCTIFDNQLKVLLVKRNSTPYKNYWAIPGGFVSIEDKESLEQAAMRKLLIKTGINDIFLEQLKTYGNPQRDPHMRVITVAYYALIPYTKIARQKNRIWETEAAHWFPLIDLQGRVAFDHREILSDLLIRLQGKISYTPIAFNLIEKPFTWTDLQQVYEIVLGRILLTPNFRRKILSQYHIKVLDARKKTKGRPSILLEYEGERGFSG